MWKTLKDISKVKVGMLVRRIHTDGWILSKNVEYPIVRIDRGGVTLDISSKPNRCSNDYLTYTLDWESLNQLDIYQYKTEKLKLSKLMEDV